MILIAGAITRRRYPEYYFANYYHQVTSWIARARFAD